MSKPSFFHLRKTENAYSFVLDPKHPLFAAHFPTYPILPGSCLADIVVKAVENSLEKRMRVSNVAMMKFISPIFPDETVEYNLTLKMTETEGQWTVNATVTSEGKNHCKAKLIFVER